MATLQTTQNKAGVERFLNRIGNERTRKDCFALLALMKRITRAEPAMWGTSIVGFGTYHYVYASGREGDWFLTGFSPRKQNISIYVMSGFSRHANLLKKLGTYKTGVSCLYVKSLSDIDVRMLEEMVKASVASLRKTRRPRG